MRDGVSSTRVIRVTRIQVIQDRLCTCIACILHGASIRVRRVIRVQGSQGYKGHKGHKDTRSQGTRRKVPQWKVMNQAMTVSPRDRRPLVCNSTLVFAGAKIHVGMLMSTLWEGWGCSQQLALASPNAFARTARFSGVSLRNYEARSAMQAWLVSLAEYRKIQRACRTCGRASFVFGAVL